MAPFADPVDNMTDSKAATIDTSQSAGDTARTVATFRMIPP